MFSVSSAGLTPQFLTTLLLRWSLKNSLHISFIKMTQIKLSIAFVLAAAVIAPIVAEPILDAVPIRDGDVELPHHHRHHHGHHYRHHHRKRVEQSPLEQTSEWVYFR